MIWQSEAILYGLMILNGVACLMSLFWAWRKGYFHSGGGGCEVILEPCSIENKEFDSGQ